MAAYFFREPTPGLHLARTGRLVDCDAQVGELALDLFSRKQMQTAHQYGRFEHGRLSAIEALKGLMGDEPHEAAA